MMTIVPELDIDQVREDFEAIWEQNVIEVLLTREGNPMAGDYFSEDETNNLTVNKIIKLNIQGTGSSNKYKRDQMGIIKTDSVLHAYALYSEDIEETDFITFQADSNIQDSFIKKGTKFKIENFNKSSYQGQRCFQEMDLRLIK